MTKLFSGLLVLAGFSSLAAVAAAAPKPPHDYAIAGIGCSDCHTPYGGGTATTTGTASAGTKTTLIDANAVWTTGEWAKTVISFTSGPNSGQFREVAANTSDTVSWAVALPTAVLAGEPYAIAITTEYDQQAKCKTCHNPTGQASALAEVAVHAPGSVVVGCGKCHEPHNLDPNSGVGNGMIRDSLRWPTAGPVNFPSGNPDSEFIAASAPFDGVCETCHIGTLYHRNSTAGGHTHEIVGPCVTCHTHKTGFAAPDCVTCHGVAQDNGDGIPPAGRRAVFAEFPTGADAMHAHFDGVELGKDDCLVCHDMSNHKEGSVKLVAPDIGGPALTFVTTADLTSDPDLSDFCSGCHDADGANRLPQPMSPFANANAPPDVASRFMGTVQWNEFYGDGCFGNEGTNRLVNSHHDLSDTDQAASGAKLECTNCHGSHTVSKTYPMSDPFDTLSSWTADTDSFCLQCHGGGAGPSDPGLPPGVVMPAFTGNPLLSWPPDPSIVAIRGIDSCGYGQLPHYVDYTWTNCAHGQDSKRDWLQYSGAPESTTGDALQCVTCHDSHGSYTPTNPAGNIYMIRDVVDGSRFVDDGYRPGATWNGPPWSNNGTAREVTVVPSGTDVDWGSNVSLCETCHAGWLQAYSWHSFCTACQTCHAHGANWGENDWGAAPNDSVYCP